MKTLLTTTALVAFFAAAPAFSQTDTQPAVDQPPAASETLPDASMPDAVTSEMPAAVEDVAPKSDAGPDTAATPPSEASPNVATTEPQTFINQQSDNQKLASEWIGRTVYTAAGDNVGDINDLLINADGRIAAVILGVGGFLGIGEKEVAIAFNSIDAQTDANGTVLLVTAASKEQLEAAPEFVSLAAKATAASTPAVPDPTTPAPMR